MRFTLALTGLTLTLLLNSCCKCVPDVEGLYNIEFVNFEMDDFSDPYLIYTDDSSADTVWLTLHPDGDEFQLQSVDLISITNDWKVQINDSTSFVVDNFVTDNYTGCCKGLYIKSYDLDGTPVESQIVTISK